MELLWAFTFVCHLSFGKCTMHQSATGFRSETQCTQQLRTALAAAEEWLRTQQGPSEINYPRLVLFGFCRPSFKARYPA